MAEQKITLAAYRGAGHQLNAAEAALRTGTGRGSFRGDTHETSYAETHSAENHAYEQTTLASAATPTSDFPLQVFTSSATIVVLSRDVVEFLGIGSICRFGHDYGVKVVKCVSPMTYIVQTGEGPIAAIGSFQNLQQFEQRITSKYRAEAAFLEGEYLNKQYREDTLPQSAQKFAHGQQQQTNEWRPPTHHPNSGHLHQRVVTQQPLSRNEQLQVNEITMRYVNEFLLDETASIEKSYQVTLKWSSSSDDGSAMLSVLGVTAQSDVTTATKKLAQICMGVSNTLEEARLPIPEDAYANLKAQLDLKAEGILMSYDNTDDGHMCIIAGPSENVKITKGKLKKLLSSLPRTVGPRTVGNCVASLAIGGRQIFVKKGDLTKEAVDAVVNAANENLGHHGGVAKAILDAGGETIQEESNEIMKKRGTLRAGDAVYTRSGRLPCKFVIHAVAPYWKGQSYSSNTLQKLQLTCSSSLRIASELNLKSIAIPGLGSGIYAIPKDKCALTLFTAVEDFFRQVPSSSLIQVIFINIDDETTFAFERECKTRAAARKTHNGRSPSTNQSTDDCPICYESPTENNPMIKLPCEHRLCRLCRCKLTSPVCPFCQKPFGTIVGNQPKGSTMHTQILHSALPGYESHKTIQITYNVPNGVQTEEHPTPGKRYYGTMRQAYLPDNEEGREVLGLLKKAFERRLTFTIGRSVTSGHDGVITWNDIHHKTSQTGGANFFGYPDPGYLQRVKKELESKGIR